MPLLWKAKNRGNVRLVWESYFNHVATALVGMRPRRVSSDGDDLALTFAHPVPIVMWDDDDARAEREHERRAREYERDPVNSSLRSRRDGLLDRLRR